MNNEEFYRKRVVQMVSGLGVSEIRKLYYMLVGMKHGGAENKNEQTKA